MKIEDLYFPMPNHPVDEKTFDLEKWRREKPMDYLMAAYLINTASNKNEVFSTIYNVTRLYIPDTLYKYFSLSEDPLLNKKKFDTLLQKKVYMSTIKDFNDPFDGRAFYYNPNVLKRHKRLRLHKGRLIDDFTAYILGASLTANGVNSMPMWAHYASNHTGFCVSYNMKHNTALSSCTFPVQYTNQRLDITSLMDSYANMVINQIKRQPKLGYKEITIVKMIT